MKRIRHAIKKEGSAIKKELQEKTAGYIITAFGIVAGLAWNDFVKALIEAAFPIQNSANNLWAKFIYAFLITLFVVFVSVYLSRIFIKEKEENEKNN